MGDEECASTHGWTLWVGDELTNEKPWIFQEADFAQIMAGRLERIVG